MSESFFKLNILIAIAANDDAKQPDAKAKLKTAFSEASLPASIEVFSGTSHGWCPPDSHVYDHDAAEGFSGQNYFPDGMAREQFYVPKETGFEREIAKRLEYWSKLRAKRAGEQE